MTRRIALWDFDGTLFNTSDALYKAYRRAALMVCGAKIPRRIWDENFGRGIRDVAAAVGIEDEQTVEKIRAAKYSMYPREFLRKIRPVTESVRKMAQYDTNTVCTTTSISVVRRVLREFGLSERVTAVYSSADNPLLDRKPAPDVFLSAAFDLCAPGDVIHIYDDSPTGIEAAVETAKRISDAAELVVFRVVDCRDIEPVFVRKD